MKHILNTVFLSVLLLLSSCERYLEVNPDSTLDVEINSEEKIAELLTAAYPEASYSAFLEARLISRKLDTLRLISISQLHTLRRFHL